MWKKIRTILMVLLAAVFMFSAGTIAVVQHQYRVSKRLYREASAEFTAPAVPNPVKPGEDLTDELTGQIKKHKSEPDDGVVRLRENAPIKVDFKTLQEKNPDIVGWIYCPDTVIDYPVLHGETNDSYLHRSYDGSYNASGSIFEDSRNPRGFSGPLSILYGHHMGSGAMFASLDKWQTPAYFDEHPVMWILTPDQDYKVELYSVYNTSAYSDTYSFFYEWGEEFTDYLWRTETYSEFRRSVELDPSDRYVVLSTCAYFFEDARSVLHGRLRPVMSAGGEAMVPNAAQISAETAERTEPESWKGTEGK